MACLSSCKDDFPMLKQQVNGKPLTYLDTAATAHKPQCVIDVLNDLYSHRYGTVHRAIYETAQYATSQYEESRSRLAQFLNASKSEEIIFTKGTTEAINLVATVFERSRLKPGDEVIISCLDHHSNIVPWQMAAQNSGATLKVIQATPGGDLDLDHFESLLSPQTKIVAVAHVANSIGTIHPVKKIIEKAHEVGAWVLVDGAQATPSMKVDVQDFDCEFYCFSGHKLYGPTGVGILYGKYHCLEEMVPYQGGGEMIEEVGLTSSQYALPPLRFEAGTPMIAEAIALKAVLDYLSNFNMDAIHKHTCKLAEIALQELNKIEGVQIIGTPKNRSNIVNFVVKGLHSLDIATLLNFSGVAIRSGHHCAQPAMKHFGITHSLRASFALYNDEEDIEVLLRSLKDSLKVLC